MKRPAPSQSTTPSTRWYVAILGTLTGIIGVIHVIFETLRGNTPTGGPVLVSIGAISIIPNYLITGIAAIIAGLAVIGWAVRYIQTRWGAIIFLFLSLLLFLVGGGVALVLGAVITWGVATQINKPLNRWRKLLSPKLRSRLSKMWPVVLVTGLFFLFIGIIIWLFLLTPRNKY